MHIICHIEAGSWLIKMDLQEKLPILVRRCNIVCMH